MPLTLSHPAAAVPMRRVLGRRGDLTALVIGSMTPDFTYYLPVAIKRGATHSLDALFWFCLPAGIAAYLLFDQLLKAPCAFLCPEGLRRRFGPLSPSPLSTRLLLAVATSVLVGACTHIVWDSLTHGRDVLSLPFAALRRPLVYASGIPISANRLLQYASSIGGGALLAVWLTRWYRSTPPGALPETPLPDSARRPITAALLAAPLLTALLSGAAIAAAAPRGAVSGALVVDGAVTTLRLGVVAALLSLTAYGLWWRWRDTRRASRA